MIGIRRGNDYTGNRELVMQWTDPDTGLAIDLTGADGWFVVKRRTRDADIDALIFKTTDDGITIDPDQVTNKGRATIEIARADTADLERVVGWAAAQMLDSSGRIFEVAWSRFELTGDLVLADSLVI